MSLFLKLYLTDYYYWLFLLFNCIQLIASFNKRFIKTRKFSIDFNKNFQIKQFQIYHLTFKRKNFKINFISFFFKFNSKIKRNQFKNSIACWAQSKNSIALCPKVNLYFPFHVFKIYLQKLQVYGDRQKYTCDRRRETG